MDQLAAMRAFRRMMEYGFALTEAGQEHLERCIQLLLDQLDDAADAKSRRAIKSSTDIAPAKRRQSVNGKGLGGLISSRQTIDLTPATPGTCIRRSVKNPDSDFKSLATTFSR